MESNTYHLIITELALKYINTHLISSEEEPKAIVISTAGRIGGGYQITSNNIKRLKQLHYHEQLALDQTSRYPFPIFVEPLVMNGNFLPNPFVIDLVKNYNGELKLDVKNPAFESY
jgi:hypothetical protein